MNIVILGLGYVGVVSATCLARDGHKIIGVDINPVKVDLVNEGKSPIIETGLDTLISQAVEKGNLRATTDIADAVRDSDMAFICVGTPNRANGDLDLGYVNKVCCEVGAVLKDRDSFYTVVMRSTVLPGSNRKIAIPALEETSGKTVGKDIGYCSNPEFLREGSAIYDYDNPPKIVIGTVDEKSRKRLESVYKHLDAPLISTELEVAELVKYADNAWHAVKINFANEMGSIAKSVGVDGRKVMDIFCQDKKLNISSAYLRPGFAFGGSCLPKDLRALTYRGRVLDLDLPLLNSAIPSNEQHLKRALSLVLAGKKGPVAILGLSFKAGTDDLRESPMVYVVEQLIGKGFDLKIYDHHVRMASLVGANKDYILNTIPHISSLLTPTLEEAIDGARYILIGNGDPDYAKVVELTSSEQTIIDFNGIKHPTKGRADYDGICW